MMEIFIGSINAYDPSRGFGFIRRAKGKDVYFSLDNCPNMSIPQVGIKVQFNMIKVKKGNKAINIQFI